MYTWTYIEQIVFTKPAHIDVSVPDHEVPDPTQNGYARSIGDIEGQEADYEKAFDDGTRVHLRKFKDCYLAHWDFFSPILSPFQHLRHDSPIWYVVLSTAAGCALGAGCSKDRVTGGLVGGGAGFVLSLLTLPNADE